MAKRLSKRCRATSAAGCRQTSMRTDDTLGFGDGSSNIIGALIEVHRELGPGLLESAYEHCVAHELSLRGIAFERQRVLAVNYKGLELESAYRVDFIVGGRFLLELKCVEKLTSIHEAQVLTYLKLTGL